MIKKKISIINKLGLHARAAAKLTKCACEFSASVQIGYAQREIDAKSIMSVMMLAAAQGAEIEISCDGTDEEAAMQSLEALINNRFDEDE